ncbi:DUF1127 domain-containing protein [Rhizobium sp. BK176]|uniref:DUF1127 domain-containing protein n=1 Tax=Rhizobium sp. BK176 TaxID=2587071 RepID=UPI002168BA50|nr:DUF1127 domain-containing protein [Rhizobium sp. BK176]MCS4088853.1 uncharacterized protein YjiS (DUF1127 family) [Rhizobium sp. BK176]
MTAVANDNACNSKGNAISRFIRKYIEARRARQGMRDMLSLGDHLLRDIGVTRFDVHTALNAPSGSCGERLAILAEENRRTQFRMACGKSGFRPQANETVKLAA